MARPTHSQLAFEKFPRNLPLRKSRPDIPEDVYLSVFEFITQPVRSAWCSSNRCPFHSTPEDKKEYRSLLSNLTLVCRFFAVVFVPILFSSMSTYVPDPHLLDRLGNQTSLSCAEALLRNDSRACARILYAKDCTLHMLRATYPKFWDEGAGQITKITKKLPCTTESLYLISACIANKFFTALATFTHLTSLAFSYVTFSSRLVFPQNATLKLQSIALFSSAVDSVNSTEAIIGSLATFLYSDSIRILHTNNYTFFKAFMNRSRIFYLEELEYTGQLSSEHIPILLLQLSRMPFLKTLSIVSPPFDYQATADTTSGSCPLSMPMLQSLQCPSVMASVLVPGQPLQEVGLYDFPRNLPEGILEISSGGDPPLSYLVQSTASIEVLHIPSRVYFASASSFSDAFPCLDELSVKFPMMRGGGMISFDAFTWHISAVCEVMSTPSPPITRLHISFGADLAMCRWACNLALQAKMISSLHLTFPSLRYIQFASLYDKGWIWCLENEYGRTTNPFWKPSIGNSSRLRIQSALTGHRGWYPKHHMDVDRTFATLFNPRVIRPRRSVSLISRLKDASRIIPFL